MKIRLCLALRTNRNRGIFGWCDSIEEYGLSIPPRFASRRFLAKDMKLRLGDSNTDFPTIHSGRSYLQDSRDGSFLLRRWFLKLLLPAILPV